MSSKQVALITGANKGIGLAVARQLGEQGYTIWLGCRDVTRGESAVSELHNSGIDVHHLTLDVADTKSVAAAKEQFQQHVDALDVLINNAGVSIGTPMRVTEENVDDIRSMFEVNTFGPIRVTQAFLPLLRRAKAARIVMVSSSLGSISKTMDTADSHWSLGYPGYSASKSALNMFTAKLAKELLPDGIKVNAVNPGFTATDINGHTGRRTVEEAAKVIVELAAFNPFAPTGGFFHDGHAQQHRYTW